MGKEHLYVWDKQPGMLHEDEAAFRLQALCQNEHMHATPVKEGKIELIADIDGLFRVDVARLNALNGEDEIMIATRHTNTAVHQGDKLAAYGIEVTEHCLPGDDRTAITAAALDYKARGGGPDPVYRRHERGPGRQDPQGQQGHRRGDRVLRSPGAPPHHRRGAGQPGRPEGSGPRRAVPGLSPVPLPRLPLW